MSPEERRLLTDLFDRIRVAAATPRDREAEELIRQKLGEQPYAAYFMAQAVIVQDQALQATTRRLQELEDEVQRLEAQGSSAPAQSGGFLGSLGSLFGSQSQERPPQRYDSSQREGRLYDDHARGNRERYSEPEPEPTSSPWGRAGATGPWARSSSGMMGSMSGGSFLGGALSTAAGVAGGVLVADAVKDMFSPHMGGTNPLASAGNPLGATGGETTINNFFDGDDRRADKADSRSDDRSGDRDDNVRNVDDTNDDNDDDGGFDFGGFDDDDSFA